MLRIFLVAAATSTLLAGCKPSEPAATQTPPIAALAGHWKMLSTRKTCDQNYLRFVGDKIILHRDHLPLPIYEIRRAAANGSDFDLELTPTRMMVQNSHRNVDRLEEMMKSELRLTLSLRSDRLSIRNAQFNEPSKGLRVASSREQSNLEHIFTLEKCPAGKKMS